MREEEDQSRQVASSGKLKLLAIGISLSTIKDKTENELLMLSPKNSQKLVQIDLHN